MCTLGHNSFDMMIEQKYVKSTSPLLLPIGLFNVLGKEDQTRDRKHVVRQFMTLAQHLAGVTQCSRYRRWIIYLTSDVNILAVHAIFPHSQINYCKETKPWILSA
jgi:hypothetical protein